MRTCIGCGGRAERQHLLRVVRAGEQVICDERGVIPGRGAWLHRSQACIDKAIAREAFSRALRVSGRLDTTPLENRLEIMMDK